MHLWWSLIDQGRPDESESPLRIQRRVLLLCGIASSLVYVFADVLGSMRYAGYSYASQAISELVALGSPVRAIVNPLFVLYDLLLLAFGLGVWISANRTRSLRFTAACLIAITIVGLAWPFAPMHTREVLAVGGRTLTDTLHIVFTVMTVTLIVAAMGFGAAAFGKWFRLYSIGTILILVAFGIAAGSLSSRLELQQPTPWLGIVERVNVYSYLLWVAILALALLRYASSRLRER